MTQQSRADLAAVLNDIDHRLDDALDRINAIDDSDSAELFHPLDGALCGVYHGLKNGTRYAIAHSPAQHDSFDPAETLGQYNASRPVSVASQRISVMGDKRIVATVLQLLRENVELSVGGRLQMRLYTEGSIRYTYSFAEESTLGDSLSAGNGLDIPVSVVHNAWEAATDGGYMELSPTGVVLFLEGEAPGLDHGDSGMDTAARALAPAVLRLRSWRSPSGAYEGPFAATSEAKRLYAQAATTAKDGIEEALGALTSSE